MSDWVILAPVAMLIFGFTVIYNRLVALKQTRKGAFADIDVQLKMRHDLVPNLAEVVKKYAAHEKGVFENVTQARAQAMQAHTVDAKSQAEGALSESLMKMLAVAENYPELKADKNFAEFQTELSNIEKSIAAARRFFNNATAEYNTAIQQFPAVFLARIFNYNEEVFFDVGGENRFELDKPVTVTL